MDFDALVVPIVLTSYILHHTHDSLGHNETLHTYHFVKCLYYWKGLQKGVANIQDIAKNVGKNI